MGGLSDAQAVNGNAVNQMGFDNLVDVTLIDELMPNGFRVDHHDRALEASAKTSGFVDTHHARLIELEFGNARLGIIEHGRGTVSVATGVVVGALIATDKDMLFEVAHGRFRDGRECPDYRHDYRRAPVASPRVP